MSCLLFITAPSADFKIVNRLLFYLRYGEYGPQDSFNLVRTKNAFDLDTTTVPPILSTHFNAWKGSSLADVEAFMLDLNRPRDGTDQGREESKIFVLLDEKGLEGKTCIVACRRHHFDSDDEDGAESRPVNDEDESGPGNDDEEKSEPEYVNDDDESRPGNDDVEEDSATANDDDDGDSDDSKPRNDGDERANKRGFTIRFDKARVPWDGIWLAWANLSCGNMSLDEFCDNNTKPDEEGCFVYDYASFSYVSKEERALYATRDEEIAKLELEGLA